MRLPQRLAPERYSLRSPGGLLASSLLGFILIIYAYAVYTVVVSLGTFPFGNTPSRSLLPTADQSLLNLLSLLILSLTIVPIGRWLQGRVNDLIYAQHDNPYALLALINQQLRDMQNPQVTLPQVAETIGTNLHLPYVALVDDSAAKWSCAFGGGQGSSAAIDYPITYLDRRLGTLRVTNRDRSRSAVDMNHLVLSECVQQIGIALAVAELTADLQDAREKLVIAREEERRRIRNDLHDGVAPSLSALQLQVGTIRRRIAHSPNDAEQMLVELGDDLRQATAEIRQIVYNLRPPMLDELGLIDALNNLYPTDASLQLTTRAPDPMPALSAAIEVAVYRIVAEAIHNVVKHAQATTCVVDIKADAHTLALSVIDNGQGFANDNARGIGVRSMHERAAELGGTFAISSAAERGTRIDVRLPLPPGK